MAPSPLSPTNWPPESWKPLPLVLAFLGLGAVFVVSIVLYFVGLALVHAPFTAKFITSPNQVVIAQVVTSLPIVAYMLIVLPPLAKTSLSGLGLRTPTGSDLAWAIGGALAMFVLVDASGALIAAVSHRQDTEQAVELLKQMKTPFQQISFFVIACVVAPLTEELVFRGFVLNALTRYTPVWVAIVASGIVFGLLHAASLPQTITVSIPLALGGMLLAYVYLRTKNFWANVITHATFNSIGVSLYFVFHIN